VIDHESDRTALPAQRTDVILKWTKKRKDPSHSQTSSSDGPPASGSGSDLRDNHSSRMRSSPLHNSRTNDPPPTLPSDAVDLVVEDSHVGEEEQSHERRTAGRVRVNPHLKKVYHGGGGAGAEGEEEEDPYRSRRVGAEEEIPFHSGLDYGDGADGDSDRVIVIEGTPPPHARMHAYKYDDIPVNDNPWA